MFHKTSWRIRHFIAQRRTQDAPDIGNDFDDARFTDLKLSISTPKRLSWLSQAPSAEATPLRRASSNATVRSFHIHQPGTAHSSASSLCSCDCNDNPAPIEQSLSRLESPPVQAEILYLPPEAPASTSEDAKTWRLIFPEPSPRSSSLGPASVLRVKTPCLTIAPIEPNDLTDEVADDDKTPTQSIKQIEIPDMEPLSDNVEQLIRETDEAFKAVGTALADARAATQGWYDTKSTPVTRRLSMSRGILRKEKSRSPVLPIKSSVIKATPNAKGKSKRPANVKKKSILFGRAFHTPPKVPPPPHPLPPPAANAPARWTLNDVTTNMVDVFNGKRFRTEVDEMLTPVRIQKLKDQVTAENERRESEESQRSNTSHETDGSTPTEPFHLESLSERIDAVKQKQQERGPHPPPRPPPPTETILVETPSTRVSQCLSEGAKRVGFAEPIIMSDPMSRAGMIFNNFSFPAPPFPPSSSQSRSPRRGSAGQKGIPMLPTIPEISPLNLSPSQFFRRLSKEGPGMMMQSTLSYFLLPATHFTMTSPFFRHGPIRIERVMKHKKEMPLSPQEESLDWVAFQMAMSGNMDEYGRNIRSDSEWEADEIELDEIEIWWEEFGLELGGMETAPPPLKEQAADEMKEEMTEVPKPKPLAVREKQKQIGIGVHKAAEDQLLQTWRAELDTAKVILPDDAPKILVAVPPPAPVQGEIRRPSLAESMPPSPMLDLGVVSPMKDGDIIPMGFNLGHDLEDFLKWGTNHVQNFSLGK
ncbi:hypothetical protein EG329_004814 [Mollisiaceae sp. DMI_Dod_QoI]|nr:hypothetical protein EG329_004814 [Helotiales sp. DMI_Dod_QoI]